MEARAGFQKGNLEGQDEVGWRTDKLFEGCGRQSPVPLGTGMPS